MATDVEMIIKRQYEEIALEYFVFNAFADMYCEVNHCEFTYRMFDQKEAIERYCKGKKPSEVREALKKHVGVPFCEIVGVLEND